MRTIFLYLLLLLPVQILFSQTTGDTIYGQDDAVLDSAVNNIAKQLSVFPQEKIYLHTDKPYYITGEKIFFRAFLIEALSNRQEAISRYVYVELINPVDSVVQRLKIRRDSTYMFYGAIPLPEDLPQGDYQIRAYTQYMRNQGESSFFSKQVRISDPQILSVQTESDFQIAEDGKINASLRFTDAKSKEVIIPQSISLRLNQYPPFTRKPDKDGWIRLKLTVPPNAPTRVLYVELTNSRNALKQYIPIPYPEGDFDVSFYPEGGHLIAGQSSNVAFKALSSNGKSLDITGEVVDSKDNIVTVFKTLHDGMGDFYVNPLPDDHYQAVCHYGDRTLRFDLPQVQKNVFALKTLAHDNKLWISINKQDSLPYPELYLLIHSRGLVIFAKAWDFSKDFITFNKSILPSGITHILLLTKDLQIISERLVFLLSDDNGTAVFKTQKDSYHKREYVQSEIQLVDEKQKPLVAAGNFSIAVTNDREVIADTASSILSGILLRSELKGRIDNPEYYFQKGNKKAELAADLLMKTHGWTRYDIPKVMRGELSYPKIPFELSQEFSGMVKSGLLSKLAKGFKVSLISLSNGFFDMTETDENGRYRFGNFEFPDSTKYVIQALNSKDKGKQMTELYVDEDTFPAIPATQNTYSIKEGKDSVFMDYVAKADLYYTYENGTRIVNLPEVQVRGVYKGKDNDKYKSVFYSSPDYSLSSDEIEKRGGTSDVKNLLYGIGGVMVSGNSIRIRGAAGPPLIVIDDVPYEASDDQEVVDNLNMININDIGKLDVLKNISNTAAYGSRGANGVIVIYTKRGDGHISLPSFNIKPLIPLGYQLPIEFYSPKYDTQESANDSKPDFRTTIYWKPNVITDAEGNVKLDFYTADDPATYSVVIEGVSDDGKLIHYRGNSLINVK